MAVRSPLKLRFVWAVVRDVLFLAGDLALFNTGAVVATKVDTHIHRKHEAQHLDSSPEACIPVKFGDVQFLPSTSHPPQWLYEAATDWVKASFLSFVNQEKRSQCLGPLC